MSHCALSNRFTSCLIFIVSLVGLFSVFLTSATVAAQDYKTVGLPTELQQIRAQLEISVREEKRRERERVFQVGEKAANPLVDSADSLALVALYNSTAGASWVNKSNWLTGPVATWFGITVNGDRVSEISLPGNNLVGTIPGKLGDLTALTSLNLGIVLFGSGENQLSGSIPSELGNLTELTLLWLEGNQLTGPIPSSIGNLTQLETLDFGNFFGGNLLTGSIPSSFGNLTSLQSLRLVGNQLSGPIPASIGNLSSLFVLELGGNMLTGSIPPELGNLASLAILEMGTVFGGNELTGTIPASLGNLQNLVLLSLDRNQLEGTIPPALAQLPMLESLSLMGNRLTGSIPPELGNMANLASFNLGMDTIVLDSDGNWVPISLSNLLSGEIPSQLGNLTKMVSLLFSNNAFTGAVPSSFANLNMLRTLMLNCNQLEDLPSFSTIPDFSALFVEKNRFTFEDIEPNVGVATTAYTYSPQASVPVTVAPAGSDLVLSVEEVGPNNQYQWFLHGSPIAGANQSSFTISASDSNGIAAYHVEITNSVAADLTLSSQPTYSDIVVNDAGDGSDAKLADGLCDTDLQTPGLQCTLRAALQTLAQGNALTCGTDAVQIKFEGVQIIQPNSPLPTITNSVLINGSTGGSRVEIRGGSAGQSNGFDIEGQDITLRRLKINAFSGWGVRFNGGSGHVIEDSRIGLLSEEMTNAAGGILVEGDSKNVRIGGFLESQENIVGGGVQIIGSETTGIRVLRNVLELPESMLSTGMLRVPLDLNGDGPTCSAWDTARSNTPNMEVSPPRVLELTSTSLHGAAQSGATVVVYRVVATGTDRGRYWARSVLPIGVGIADAAGFFDVDFDFEQEPGAQITLSMTDPTGNTSELSQVRRPVVYLPGVGGSWLRGKGGDHLFLPNISAADYFIRLRLDRLAMDESGQASASGETIWVDGILELPGLYRAVLQHLEAEGFVGNSTNSNEATLDLWRFAYDWRRNPAFVADDLQTFIDHMTSLSGDVAAACEVDIVTHSNGGLVASAYIWRSSKHRQNHVNRLLMSAAPYWGTPQVAAAHTRGYLFDFQKIPFTDYDGIDLDWGRLVRVFQNLPNGYGLLPSKTFMEAIAPDAPQQNDWYLTDLFGRPLRGYNDTFKFMTDSKLNLEPGKEGEPLGLARNDVLWSQVQDGLHDKMNDWRTYKGPPHVFRQVGRKQLSTAMAWRVPPSMDPARPEGSWRVEVGDTDRHVAYREAIQPRMGWGDGTVALVSATLGRGVTRLGTKVGRPGYDYSGVSESDWIEDFEYFDCTHLGMVAAACVDDNGGSVNALQRTTETLKSAYEIVPSGLGKRSEHASAVSPSEADVFYITASGPVRVSVEDDFGNRTGPRDGEMLNIVEYGLPEVGYWASSRGAVVSVPAEKAYSLHISTDSESVTIRATRQQSNNDQATNIFFDDQTMAVGGSMRFSLSAGGTISTASFDIDSDGNGTFEGILSPAAEMLSTESGPSVPEPYPFELLADIQAGSPNPTIGLTLPDVGGPTWSWTLEEIPVWVNPDAVNGQGAATIAAELLASTLQPGIHRDTMVTALTFASYTVRTKIPVELAIRAQPAEVKEINVHLDKTQVAIGDSLSAWATGADQLGLSISVQPTWSATGGTINIDGRYIAGVTPGLYSITATGANGQVSGTSEIEIISGVATEEEETLPTSFSLDQNYPNPFNPVTTIRFALPSPEHVRLVVYDLLGREISVLIDELRSAGHHRTEFGNARLPSGVYFYRLTAGSFQQTNKMLLLR